MGSYYSLGSYFCYIFDVSDFRILDFYSEGIWIWLQWVSFLLKGSFCCFPIWQDCSIIWDSPYQGIGNLMRHWHQQLTWMAPTTWVGGGWGHWNEIPQLWASRVTAPCDYRKGLLNQSQPEVSSRLRRISEFFEKKCIFFNFFIISIASIILL